MNTVILNFNASRYDFDLANVSENVWAEFILGVLVARLNNIKGVKLTGNKITIRDNVAKVCTSWEAGEGYHEFTFHIDEWGRKSKDYNDIVSNIWQNTMTNMYGEKYKTALNKKFKENNLEAQ